MIKELITSALLTVAPIQNAIVNVKVTYNCNENIIKNNQTEVIRRNSKQTEFANYESIQWERNIQEGNYQLNNNYRTQYTIYKIQQKILAFNEYETLNAYYVTDYGNTDMPVTYKMTYKQITGEGNINSLETQYLQKTNEELKELPQTSWTNLEILLLNGTTRTTTDGTGILYDEQTIVNTDTDISTRYYLIKTYLNAQQNSETGTKYEFTASKGITEGYTKIYFQYSYNVNVDANDYEVIDIPGIMFQILGMPFTFISTAFNLTLFSGTPYALSVSNLFLTLIVTLIIIFIIRKFTK